MVAEILTAAYDAIGHPTFQPRKRPFRWFAPNAPMGRYLTQPLTVRCTSLADLRAFLADCRYVSDREQFGREDYWMYPEQFEVRKRGDCDDFALWTWRQLLAMGYDARFVCGRAGRYGGGHAWVTFTESGRSFLVEPTAARTTRWLPRLTTARYVPAISVAWDGHALRYYEHEPRRYDPTLRELGPLLVEWMRFWILTRPAYCAARGRVLVRLGRLAVGAGPRAWGHELGVIVRRVSRLWSWRPLTPRPARRGRRGLRVGRPAGP